MALGQVLPLHLNEAEWIPAGVAASGRDPAVDEALAGWPDDMRRPPPDTRRVQPAQDNEEPDIGPGPDAAMDAAGGAAPPDPEAWLRAHQRQTPNTQQLQNAPEEWQREQLRWGTGPGASLNTGGEPGPGFQAGQHDDAAGGPTLAALLTAFGAHQHQEDRKVTAAMQAELAAMQTELNTVQAELNAMQATLTMQTEYTAPPGVGGPATSPNLSGHQQTDTNNDAQRGQVDASGGQTWTDGLP